MKLDPYLDNGFQTFRHSRLDFTLRVKADADPACIAWFSPDDLADAFQIPGGVKALRDIFGGSGRGTRKTAPLYGQEGGVLVKYTPSDSPDCFHVKKGCCGLDPHLSEWRKPDMPVTGSKCSPERACPYRKPDLKRIYQQPVLNWNAMRMLKHKSPLRSVDKDDIWYWLVNEVLPGIGIEWLKERPWYHNMEVRFCHPRKPQNPPRRVKAPNPPRWIS